MRELDAKGRYRTFRKQKPIQLIRRLSLHSVQASICPKHRIKRDVNYMYWTNETTGRIPRTISESTVIEGSFGCSSWYIHFLHARLLLRAHRNLPTGCPPKKPAMRHCAKNATFRKQNFNVSDLLWSFAFVIISQGPQCNGYIAYRVLLIYK